MQPTIPDHPPSVPPRVRPTSDRVFGIVMSVLFTLLGTVLVKGFGLDLRWPFGVAALFLVTALAVPWVLLPLNHLWGLLARRLGAFNNRLLLGVVYFGLICPVGLIRRLGGGDAMGRRFDPEAPTYLTPVGRQTTPETLKDLF